MRKVKNYQVKFKVTKEGEYSYNIFLEFQGVSKNSLKNELEKSLLETLEGIFKQKYEIVEIKELKEV